MKEFAIKHGVNFDYVLAIRLEDGIVEEKRIPIKRNLSFLERLKQMYYDDSFDISDMYGEIERYVEDYGALPYCLNHEYRDHYISDMTFPSFDRWEYNEKVYGWRDAEKERRLKTIAKLEYSDRQLYLKKKGIIEKQIEERVIQRVRKDKETHADSFVSYVYAYDYHRTLLDNKIDGSYYLYSNDIHGRFEYTKQINDDLKIKTKTNFCYGIASYFHLTVTYKGIDLLPYSAWVKYYYARYNELLRFTRHYLPVRNCWDYCIAFIEGFLNKAISEPDRFIKEDVMTEVNGLMQGLESIFSLVDSDFEKALKVNHIADDDERYIGISSARHANDQDRVYYQVSPAECAMVYRMEKISGALHFLNSLRQFSELYGEINDAIERILEMNRQIYPNVVSAIPPVSVEISKLKTELHPLVAEADMKQKRFDKLQQKLDTRYERAKDNVSYMDIKTAFIKSYPSYMVLAEELNVLNRTIHELQQKLATRKQLFDRLNSFRELIEKEAQV